MKKSHLLCASGALALMLAGCDGSGDGFPPGAPAGPGPTLLTGMPVVVAATRLSRPRDLDFNPRRPGELWVVNGGDHSVTLIHQATAADVGTVQVESRRDRAYSHFMPSPSSIAFGADATNDLAPNAALAPGTFATCQESRNGQPNGLGQVVFNDFMGPVLWSSDLAIFARSDRQLGSHLDMLHQSPLCMGITWEGQGNVYWTVNGLSRSLARYDFALDHGIGNDNHDDGYIWRFLVGELGYVEGVPSHLFYDREEGALYVADTGKSRILRLHPGTSMKTGPIVPAQDEREGWEMAGADVQEVVTAASGLLQRPSGLEISGGHLYVSDNATSTITKLRKDGTPVAITKVEVPTGSLAGLAFGPDGRLYFVDMLGNRVLRLEPF
jgi:hypothetical protein